MSNGSKHPETLALHAGYRKDSATNAVAVPIYQTTSYQFDSTEHAANLFGLKELGNIYTRIMNPTCDVLEQRIAAIEGGVAALALSSGQAASAVAIHNIAQAGDNIVSSTDLYGGTWNLFANTFKTMGIEVRFVDPADPEAFRRATDDKTRAYYAETLPNPKLTVFPIREVADIANELGVPLIVDNTAAPILCRPFDHGAVWTEAVKPLGPIAYIIKARVTLQRDLGYAMSPFNAFLFIQGLETLPLRMREHCRNAQAVADYLAGRSEVTKVIFPGFFQGEQKRRVETYLGGRYGALVGFELEGGKEAGRRFIDSLELFYHVANIGDARSLAIHPATTTHSQLDPEEQLATGVTDGYVRLSIGLEHIDDILNDLDQGLAAAGKPAAAA